MLNDTERKRLQQGFPAPFYEATVLDPPTDEQGFLRVRIDVTGAVEHCPWHPPLSAGPTPGDVALVVESDHGNYWAVQWWAQDEHGPTPPDEDLPDHVHPIDQVTGLQSALDAKATATALAAEIVARVATTDALDARLDALDLVVPTLATQLSLLDLLARAPSATSRNTVQPPGSGIVPVTLKGFAGAATNLLDIRRGSDNALLAWFNSVGMLTIDLQPSGTTGGVLVKGAGFARLLDAQVFDSAQTFNAPHIALRRARNTEGSPQAVQSGDRLAGLEVYGHTGTAFRSAFNFQFLANETFTELARGGRLVLYATATGGTTDREVLRLSSAEAVVNEGGEVLNFRAEGDTDQNLLLVRASTDRVGIGLSSPASKLDVAGTISQNGVAVVGKDLIDAKGDLLVGTGADAIGRLAAAADGGFLKTSSGSGATGLTWSGIVQSDVAGLVAALAAKLNTTIFDAKGDLLVGTGPDTATRLAATGVAGNVLTEDPATATGWKSAPLGTNGQRLKGRINADGTIAQGTGFTVTKNGTGDYTVNFDAAFAASPYFDAIPVLAAGAVVPEVRSSSTGSVRVQFLTLAGAGFDTEFIFTAEEMGAAGLVGVGGQVLIGEFTTSSPGSSANLIVVDGIPQGYRGLRLVAVSHTADAGSDLDLRMRINDIATGTYDVTYDQHSPTAAAGVSNDNTSFYVGKQPGASRPNENFVSSLVIDIPLYARTDIVKSVFCLFAGAYADNGQMGGRTTGTNVSTTAAITKLTLFAPSNGNFGPRTRVAVYGVV